MIAQENVYELAKQTIKGNDKFSSFYISANFYPEFKRKTEGMTPEQKQAVMTDMLQKFANRHKQTRMDLDTAVSKYKNGEKNND